MTWLQAKISTRRQFAGVLMVSVLIQVFLLRRLFEALYATRVVSGLPLHRLLIYLALSNVQMWILQTPVSREIQNRVRQGLIAFDVVRPVSFLSQMAARQAGNSLAQLGFMVSAGALLFAAGWLAGPAGAAALGEYAVSLFLAFLITVGLMLIIGLIAFWTIEIDWLSLLVTLAGQFFAGALVPISLFPPVLRRIAEALPFQGTGYLPVSIYVGQLHGSGALRALALQGSWSLLLGLIAVALWKRALYRVVSQGG